MLYHIAKAILLPFIYLFFMPKVSGRENIPNEGGVIVYSNHTSLLDPIVLGCLIKRRIYFMAKQELFRNSFLRGLFKRLGAFPVKRGTADISAIKNALQTLKKGRVFGIFPEGTRNKGQGLQDFNHGIAAIAHKSHAIVIPVAILDGYRLFRPIRVIIGKPLSFDPYFNQRSNSQLLEQMSIEMSKAIVSIASEQVGRKRNI